MSDQQENHILLAIRLTMGVEQQHSALALMLATDKTAAVE